MAYLGNTPTQQGFIPAIDYFNGNGSTVAFTLSRPVASVAQVQAVIENVPQNPGDAFTVSGNTITFTSAPPSGTNNIYVYYTSPITTVVQPGQGTVGLTSFSATGTPSASNYLRGDNSWASIASSQWTTTGSDIYYNTGNVGVGTSSPDYKLDVDTSVTSNFVSRIINNSGATSSDHALLVETSTASAARIISARNAGTERFYVAGNGDVGVINTFFMNSGYGSAAAAYGCRAWVNFSSNGTIRASGNVSSVTQNGTGDYSINFSNAMPDTSYACALAVRRAGTNDVLFANPFGASSGTAFSTGSLRIRTYNSGPTAENPETTTVTIFR